MERSGNFYKAIRLGYILISILIGCMAYNSLYEWQDADVSDWQRGYSDPQTASGPQQRRHDTNLYTPPERDV